MIRFLFNSEVRIEGLETLDYLDNLCQKERFTEQGDAITFESEVNFLLSSAELEYTAMEGRIYRNMAFCHCLIVSMAGRSCLP